MPTRKIADIHPYQKCRHPEHEPPMFMVYRAVKTFLLACLFVLFCGCGYTALAPRHTSYHQMAIRGMKCTEWRTYDMFDPGTVFYTCLDKKGDVFAPYPLAKQPFFGPLSSGMVW